MKFQPTLDRFSQYMPKIKIWLEWDLGFKIFFLKPEKKFLPLKYPPWITVENTSTVEMENNGSNDWVNIKEKQRKKETCWNLEGAIYKHQSILIYKNTNLALLFLAKNFVFTPLKPIKLDSCKDTICNNPQNSVGVAR